MGTVGQKMAEFVDFVGIPVHQIATGLLKQLIDKIVFEGGGVLVPLTVNNLSFISDLEGQGVPTL